MQFSRAETKAWISVIWQFLGAEEGTKFCGRDAVKWLISFRLSVLSSAREYIAGFSNPNVFIQYQKILMAIWVDLVGSIMIIGIHEGLNNSSLAFQVPLTDSILKNDDQSLNYEGPNVSSPASHVPPTDKGATGDDGLLFSKVTDSSSCKCLNSSLGSIAVDLIETNTMDTREQLSHSVSATQVPPMYNEANSDDQLLSFKNLQFDGSIRDTMSGRDLNYMNSSSCDHFLFSDPTGITAGDTCQPLNLSQMDPAENEAQGNEQRLLQGCKECHITTELQ